MIGFGLERISILIRFLPVTVPALNSKEWPMETLCKNKASYISIPFHHPKMGQKGNALELQMQSADFHSTKKRRDGLEESHKGTQSHHACCRMHLHEPWQAGKVDFFVDFPMLASNSPWCLEKKNMSSWWFQPNRDENKKYFKPTPRCTKLTFHCWQIAAAFDCDFSDLLIKNRGTQRPSRHKGWQAYQWRGRCPWWWHQCLTHGWTWHELLVRWEWRGAKRFQTLVAQVWAKKSFQWFTSNPREKRHQNPRSSDQLSSSTIPGPTDVPFPMPRPVERA